VLFEVDETITNVAEVLTWNWYFGDGGTSNVQNPSHVYSLPGNYNITLTIVTNTSCSSSVSHLILIISIPLALFSYEATCENYPVLFTDLSTHNGGSNIISWFWDFGDPESGSANNSTMQNPDHPFTSPGDYLVKLIIENNDGCTDTTFSIVNSPQEPGLDFEYTRNCLGLETLFEVDTAVTNINEVAAWLWEFGDGGTSNLQNPVHIFAATGDYIVTLSIATTYGCAANVTHVVSIGTIPNAEITSITTTPIINEPIQFYGNSAFDSIVIWSWDFDDGASSLLQNPIHPFTEIGNYNIILNIVDTVGCSNSDTAFINVYPLPIFPDSGAIWNTIGENSLTFDNWRFRYGIIGDTTISYTSDTSFVYSKIFSLFDSTLNNPNSTYFAATRTTDDNKVYVKLPGLLESLLYDFSSDVGDTIWYSVGGVVCKDDIEFIEQSHFNVVTNKDSVLLLDNKYYTRWYLDGIMQDIWIEGIGSVRWFGLFNPIISDIALCGDSYSFACFKHFDTPLYINNPECDECFCYLLTSLNDQKDMLESITIYPNPAKDFITVVSNANNIIDTECRVYNSMGSCVYNSELDKTGKTKINIVGWEKGLYIVCILKNNNPYYVNKILVE
jgi:PKD repeat protein